MGVGGEGGVVVVAARLPVALVCCCTAIHGGVFFRVPFDERSWRARWMRGLPYLFLSSHPFGRIQYF